MRKAREMTRADVIAKLTTSMFARKRKQTEDGYQRLRRRAEKAEVIGYGALVDKAGDEGKMG
jgi:hypothetical protein